jgi:NTP pyrophosphatase (non-canonical NTP hydrolase)
MRTGWVALTVEFESNQTTHLFRLVGRKTQPCRTGREAVSDTESAPLAALELGLTISPLPSEPARGSPSHCNNSAMSTLDELINHIRSFRDERDWAQFHNPKDLATALAIEAAELQELFLWKNGKEIDDVIIDKKEHLSEELADVAWFLLLLSHELHIDLAKAVEMKLEKNMAKYPASRVRGSSRKYNEYDEGRDAS